MTGVSIPTVMMDIEFTPSSLQPPDITNMAEFALTQTMEFCIQKMGVDSDRAVVDRLRQGDSTSYGYWHYGLANQVAMQLGASDENVKAIYIYDYDATSEDMYFKEALSDPLIHLIIWVKRKTAALNSLIEALDQALVQAHVNLLSTHKLKHLLDAHLVEDSDVENRRGYGSLLSLLHHQPLLLWKR